MKRPKGLYFSLKVLTICGNDLIVATFLKQDSSVVCLQRKLHAVIVYKSELNCKQGSSEWMGAGVPTGASRET